MQETRSIGIRVTYSSVLAAVLFAIGGCTSSNKSMSGTGGTSAGPGAEGGSSGGQLSADRSATGGMAGSGGGTTRVGGASAGGIGGVGGASAGGGGKASGAGDGGSASAAIVKFWASPASIGMGQTSTLCWIVTGATTLTLAPAFGSVLGLGCLLVEPTQTTTYTLTLNGSLSAQVTVTLLPGSFTPTGTMVAARANHTATLLGNGKALVVGGTNHNRLASAELYDLNTGTFAPTGSLAVARYFHTATLLGNGKVLVVGGLDHNNSSLASAELYDPNAGTFAPIGWMAAARWVHTATLLDNGKVLIAGGCDAGSCLTQGVPSAELYDPSAGTFAPVGDMSVPRYGHSATLLSNGKVLIAGGYDKGGFPVGGETSSAELYDPSAGTFAATASMTIGRAGHTATLLDDGKVLMVGGIELVVLASAELYDPVAGAFAATGGRAVASHSHTATLLGNGKVLTAGGYGNGLLSEAELYDPVAAAFTATGRMAKGKEYHTATLLPSGRVLVTGGDNIETTLATAELYDLAVPH